MNMKKPRRLVLLVVAISLIGCFESDFPLDATPQVDLDPALLGTWRCLPADPHPDTEAANFVVTRATERVYAITFEESDEEPARYEAYLSQLSVSTVLNVKDLDPGLLEKEWVFARYSFLRPEVLEIELASDTLLEDVEKSPAAVRHAMEQFRDDPELYVSYCVCLRVE
jgi:hypothetical protein